MYNAVAGVLGTIVICEIILGFAGDVITVFGLPIRLVLGILSLAGLIISIIYSPNSISIRYIILYLSMCFVIIPSIILSRQQMDMAFNDGKGFLIGFLTIAAIINIYRSIDRSRLIVFLELAHAIFFVFIIASWIADYVGFIKISSIQSTLSQYTSTSFVGYTTEVGRMYFLNTVAIMSYAYIIGMQSSNRSIKYIIFSSIILLLANIAIGSRAMLAVSLIIVISGLNKRNLFDNWRRLLMVTMIIVPLLAFMPYSLLSDALAQTRFFNSDADYWFAYSDQIRSIQYDILVNSLKDNFLLGTGFGYYDSTFVRDWERPYSYELFYLALLLKLGIFSFLIFITIVFLMFYYMLRQLNGRHYKMISLVYIACILFVSSTNPFIDTQIGIMLITMPIVFGLDTKANREC